MGFDKFDWIKTILADGQIPDGERLVLVGTAIWYVRYGEDEFCVRQTTVAERMAVSDWVSPEFVEASFKLRPAGWQRFSRTRPEPATPPSCAAV